MTATISQLARDVRARRPQGKIGQPGSSSHLYSLVTLINKDPQASQVDTVTVTADANSQEHTFTLNGVEISFTSDGSGTKAEIAAGLAAAVNEEPLVRGQVSASAVTDTVTLTATYPGVVFTITESDSNLTTASVTSATAADAVGMGLGIIDSSSSSTEVTGYGVIAKSANLTAQVETLTVDYVSGELYTVIIEVDGDRYIAGPVTATTDDAGTSAAIAAAIEAAMPANTVVATNPTGTTVVLTSEVAGKPFKVSVGTKSGTAARLYVTHTTVGRRTDINRVIRGVSVYTYSEEVSTVGGTTVQYAANSTMKVMRSGTIWVACTETVSRGDDVWIELASGSNAAKFYASGSSTRVKLNNFKWERSERSDSTPTMALLRLDLPL